MSAIFDVTGSRGECGMADQAGLCIAIHENENIFKHSTLWNPIWKKFCEDNDINFETVNCYDADFFENLSRYDCLLWHINQYTLQDMLFARTILNVAKNSGVRVFPDFNTAWHFDDKVAEMYLLQSIKAPVAKSWTFYTLETCVGWLKKEAKFPLIAKLRCGSGSHNVRMLGSPTEAIRYAKRMFGRGYNSAPNVLFKTTSNVKSSKDLKDIWKKFNRIPDFMQNLKNAKRLPIEQGYVFLQEFIENDGYDIKIVVVKDKLSFCVRNVRKGDFRASGGGKIYHDKALVDKNLIKSAFAVSDALKCQCIGFDYVIDKNTGQGKIIEMSYGFSYVTILEAGGYWDRDAVWHDEPLNVPFEIVKNLIVN